jgi:hypothetical protein
MAEVLLEALGPKQDVGEVDEESGRDDAGEPIIESHGTYLFDTVQPQRDCVQKLVLSAVGFRGGERSGLIRIS